MYTIRYHRIYHTLTSGATHFIVSTISFCTENEGLAASVLSSLLASGNMLALYALYTYNDTAS